MPYPLNSGGAQAQFHMINEIRKHYRTNIVFEVTAANRLAFEQLKTLWANVNFLPYEEVAIKKSLFGKGIRYLKRLSRKINLNSKKEIETQEIDFVKQHSSLYKKDYLIKSTFKMYIENLLMQENYDIIQVEFYELLSMIHSLRNSKAKKNICSS